MAKLDDLIKNLCPNGVEFLPIEKICIKISSGGTPKSSVKEFYNGKIFWLRTQEVNWNEINTTSMTITEEGLKNSSAKWIPKNCVIVAMYGATAGKVAINKISLTTNQACCNLQVNEEIANYKFVYYCLASKYKILKAMGEGSQNNINSNKIKNFKIPVPPIEVQAEIVRILDTFTEPTAELTAELTARKKQYEYYRDLLLTFDGVEFKKLGEIAKYSSERISAQNLTENNYVGVDNLLSNKRGKIFSSHLPNTGNFAKFFSEDILIGNIRPYLKKIWFADCEGGASGDVLTIQVENKNIIRPKFLFYFLSSDNFFHRFNNSVKGGKMPRGDKSFVMKYEIPVPPIEEQERIVKILDRFDKLCNDISEGLPAEISARQKQYEYYRDKLLTFKGVE